MLQGRLVSLDVFRGITIALMILINNPGGDVYYSALRHADWNGLTLADLVFPFFLFIVGVAIPYSLASRLDHGESKKRILLRVIRRTVILFILGIVLNSFTNFDLSTLRIMGVLQRIAICYFVASLVFLMLNRNRQILITVFLVFFYWIMMTLVPVPGYGAGVLQKDGNLAAYVDNLVLGRGHLWGASGTLDPEGLLSTVPAVATTLIGVVTGAYFRSNQGLRAALKKMLFFGFLLIIIGVVWNIWFPINKNLWTSSFVAVTGGIALFSFELCHFLIDVRKHCTWAKPFFILGVNAIMVYVLSEVVNLALIYTSVTLADGKSIALKTLIYENGFASWAGPLNGSLLYSLAYLMTWLGIMTLFYRLRVFIRV